MAWFRRSTLSFVQKCRTNDNQNATSCRQRNDPLGKLLPGCRRGKGTLEGCNKGEVAAQHRSFVPLCHFLMLLKIPRPYALLSGVLLKLLAVGGHG